ncbi:MAG: ribosome maturation factor RimM, partial [Clostridia bacterium]|nr:ribosome maturation factor RimM [Clostridia bacterium]
MISDTRSKDEMMINEYLECGKIVNTHGVVGEVKVESYCDTPHVLASLKKVYIKKGERFEAADVKRAFVQKNAAVMKLSAINDMDTAQRMRDTVLYALRDDIPKDEGTYFIADLMGLDVIDAKSGKCYGAIKDVINRGASDIYVIKTQHGEVLFPAVDEFVVSVDIEKAVYISPIEGMFDDEI